jgi:hypothetical protein
MRWIARWIRQSLEWMNRNSGAITAAMTVVIAVTTCYYAIVSDRQWHAMLESNAITRHALDITERAWVVASVSPPVTDKDGHMTMQWTFQNIGRSPVLHMSMGQDFGFDESPPAKISEAGDIYLAPNGSGSLTVHLGPQMTGAVKQNKPLYVWFFTSYSDPSGTDRFSRECFVYRSHPQIAPAQKSIFRCNKGSFYR